MQRNESVATMFADHLSCGRVALRRNGKMSFQFDIYTVYYISIIYVIC